MPGISAVLLERREEALVASATVKVFSVAVDSGRHLAPAKH